MAIHEAACPFCQVALAPSASPSLPLGRLSRAAVFAGAALLGTVGCGGNKPKTDPQNTGGSGAPIADAGVDAAPPVVTPDRQMPMPYGAPPARRRLV